MKEMRGHHSCLSLNNEIFVAGGLYKKTTEIFNLQTRTWRSGPNLPEIKYFQLVKAQTSSQYAAFLIGGSGWNESFGGRWIELSVVYALPRNYKSFIKIGDLKTARKNHVAMVLSDELVEKCVD